MTFTFFHVDKPCPISLSLISPSDIPSRCPGSQSVSLMGKPPQGSRDLPWGRSTKQFKHRIGKPRVQLTATIVQYLSCHSCCAACFLSGFHRLAAISLYPRLPVLDRVWGSTETYMNLAFPLPVSKNTSLGSYWQWKGKQAGWFLSPALNSRALK